MRNFVRFSLGLGFASLALMVVGQTNFWQPHTTKSAIIDAVGLRWSSTTFQAGLDIGGLDPVVYLNQVNMIPIAWDADLNFSLQGPELSLNGGGTYTLGTPIFGEQHWFFNNLFSHNWVVENVDPGNYYFELEFRGGETELDSNVLGVLPFQLEVIPSLDVTVTGTASPSTLFRGQETTLDMTVRNNMNRDFITSSWWIGGEAFDDGAGGQALSHLTWEGNWWGQTISPGNSRTDLHSRWVANNTAADGTYLGAFGVVGGVYDGDWHGVSMDPRVAVTVVPEPASLVIVGLGFGVVALRRKRR